MIIIINDNKTIPENIYAITMAFLLSPAVRSCWDSTSRSQLNRNVRNVSTIKVPGAWTRPYIQHDASVGSNPHSCNVLKILPVSFSEPVGQKTSTMPWVFRFHIHCMYVHISVMKVLYYENMTEFFLHEWSEYVQHTDVISYTSCILNE